MQYYKILIVTLLLITFEVKGQLNLNMGSRVTLVKSITQLTPQQKLNSYIGNSIATGRIQPNLGYAIGLKYSFAFKGLEIQPEINYAVNNLNLFKINYTINPIAEYKPIKLKDHLLETNLLIRERLISRLYLLGGIIFQTRLFTTVNNMQSNPDNQFKVSTGVKGGFSYKINSFELQFTDQYCNSVFAYSAGNDVRGGQVISINLVYNFKYKKNEN